MDSEANFTARSYRTFTQLSGFPLFPAFSRDAIDARKTGNERESKLNMAAVSFELVKILFLRQTIDEEIAFGIFSRSKHMFCCLFVSQCKNCAFSRLPNT